MADGLSPAEALMTELGLDYEMQNTQLQAASGQRQGEFSLVNFNASGEIWNDATTLDQLSAAVPTAPQSGGNFEYDGAPPSPYLAFPGTPASASYGTPASSVYGFGARQNSSTMLAMLAGQGNIPHAVGVFGSSNSLDMKDRPTPPAQLPIPPSVSANALYQLDLPTAADVPNFAVPAHGGTVPAPAAVHRVAVKRSMEEMPALEMPNPAAFYASGGAARLSLGDLADAATTTAAHTPSSERGTPASKRAKIMTVGDEEEEEDEDDEGEQDAGRSASRTPVYPADMDSEAKRRFAHIYAEQKRRNKLKDAFAYLKDKIPAYRDKPSVSKAIILRGAAEYITKLQETAEEVVRLRKEVEELRQQVPNARYNKRTTRANIAAPLVPNAALPASIKREGGVPVSSGTGPDRPQSAPGPEPKVLSYFD